MAPQPPPEIRTPEQVASEESRRRTENDEALVGSEEDVLAQGETLPPKQGQDAPDDEGVTRREKIQRSPQDDIRGQIAARFRRSEPADERPFNNDMADPENIYGVFGQPGETLTDEEIDARAAEREKATAKPIVDPGADEPEVDPGDESRMITRIVRGKKVTLSERQWLDRAAQITAADSYLAEARETLRQAKEDRRRGTASDRQQPDGDAGADDDGSQAPREDGEGQQTGPTARDLVQKIQYGDPDEAAAEFDRLVDDRVNRIAEQGQLRRAYDQDLARSQAALAKFSEKYPDLVDDEYASMAIERGMYHLYREDILNLGITADQLPRTTQELANWHRHYRTNGYEVRPTPELLETSRERFLNWRGGAQGRTDNQPPTRRAAPSVQVNVQRDDRRMAIPNQPTRAAVPRRDAQTPVVQSRSDVVAGMRRARGQI